MNTTASIDTGDDTGLRIGNDGAGNLVAVWVSDDPAAGLLGDDLDLTVATSSDAGATWSDPAPLNSDASTDTADDSNVEIATDGNGNWVVVWHAEGKGSSTSTDIRVANSADNGATWSDPRPLVHARENINRAGADSDPHIAADGEGNFIIVWASTRDIDGDFEPGAEEDDPDVPIVTSDTDVFFATSGDGGATWSEAAPLNSDHISDGSADDDPSVATDLAGVWMVVWVRGGQLSFVRSETGGAIWTAPEEIPGAAGTGPMLLNDHAREATETTAWYAVWQGAGISVSRYLESD
ncbi:MAG: exo-alpha-sialidase, partial [Planctomycetes bacterium]|nr:exo-alpha-sialidase [Planctomycetota bacterium]